MQGLLFLLGFLATIVSGNRRVMEIINDSQDKLRALGFFDRSLERDSVLGNPQKCRNNEVTIEGEVFGCDEIDFYSFVSLKDLEINEPPHRVGASSADIWGWLSPTNREFTILALDNGVAVIDGTDPVNPCIIAKMPTRRVVDKWGDVKVYEHTMYHVKDTGVQDEDEDAPEGNAEYGIEVYDLLQLDQLDCSVEGYNPIPLFPQFVFSGHGRSHNVAINPESGLLYSTGSQKCAGGLVILDVKTNPMEPVQVGCAEEDGYTHDVQCLTYDGPDQDYQGNEICFAFNEDTLTIWDISEPGTPVIISRTLYENQVYSHQGWVNNDLTKVLLDDELDELCNGNINAHPRCDDFESTNLTGQLQTTTNVFDITDLDNPVFEGAYVHPDLAVDHNLYVWGVVHRKGWGGNPPLEFIPDPNYAYMNNYLAGVKVVDISSDDFTEWTQAGFFDIAPNAEGNDFAGAWSGYMHPSGVYAVSSIERGLFFLQPRMAFTEDFPPPPGVTLSPVASPVESPVAAPVEPPVDSPVDSPVEPPVASPIELPGANDNESDQDPALITLAVIMVGVLLVLLGFTAYRQRMHSKNNVNEDQEALMSPAVSVHASGAAGSRHERRAPPSRGSTKNPAFQEDKKPSHYLDA